MKGHNAVDIAYMKFLVLSLFFILNTIAIAGSSDAQITGVTASKRTSFELSVGDIDGLIRLTVDDKTYRFVPDNSIVIRDEDNGVYVLIAENEKYHVKVWMVPGSEKVLTKGNGVLKTSFAAVIEATDPRKNDKWSQTPRITIGCMLDYSI